MNTSWTILFPFVLVPVLVVFFVPSCLLSDVQFGSDVDRKYLYQNNVVLVWINKCITDVYEIVRLPPQLINTVYDLTTFSLVFKMFRIL